MPIFLRVSIRSAFLPALLILALILPPVRPLYAAPQLQMKLNHTLGPEQRVLDFQVSPDGSRIAYRVTRSLPPAQDNPLPPPADLFTIPATGGVAVQINLTATAAGESVDSYRFSADGSEVIFLRTTSDGTLGNQFELFRAPVDGSTPPVSVSGPIAVGSRSVHDFSFTFEEATVQFTFSDGSVRTLNSTLTHNSLPERISSISDGTSNTFFFGEQPNNLNQFPVTGGRRQLNPPLTSGGAVYDFAITPDGTRAIYRADQNLDGSIELFSVPADGSDAGFRISGPLVAGGDVLGFQVNADSTRAVYLADQSTNGITELYSARTNGGSVPKLNGPLAAGGAVVDFDINPDGTIVVYLADQLADGQFDLFTVAGGGGQPALLSQGLSGRSVRAWRISPDGSRVIFAEQGSGGVLTLLGRPLAAGLLTSLDSFVAPPVAALSTPDLKFDADGSHLVYLADAGNNGVFELAVIRFTGSPTVFAQINGNLPSGGNIRAFQISPDGSRVVYAAEQNSAGVVELFSVPIEGGPVEQVSGPLVAGGGVSTAAQAVQFSPDGRIVYYLADAETDGVTELYAAYDAPSLRFTQAGYVVAEDGSVSAQLAVQREGILAQAARVRVELTGSEGGGGTAKGGASLGVAGVDFVNNARDVLFAGGQITATFSVPVKNDGLAEAAESFTMRLFEPVSGTLALSDTAQVTIVDSAASPMLDDKEFRIAENSANNTPVQPIAAAGVEANTATTYAILSGNTGNAFRVDNSGGLFVNSSAALDYETNPKFVLVVEARDGAAFDLATWTVHLQNVNEPPILLAGQTRSVAENSPNNALVGSRLQSTDPDGQAPSFTTSSPVFGISSDGQLFVKSSSQLDFESVQSFSFGVTVTDGGGLSSSGTVTVQVLDVDEPPPGPVILSLSPSSVTAGGSAFKLTVTGTGLTSTSVVRWNGSSRTTILSGGKLIALIRSTDIAASGFARVSVFDNAGGKLSNTVFYFVRGAFVGVPELTIEPGEGSPAGVPTRFHLAWTHTTETWRAMNEMDMRLVDGETIPLWIRYQESRDEAGNDSSRLFLLNADGTPAGSGLFGEAKILENETARIDLSQATFTGSGDSGSRIAVDIPVVFKAAAVQEEAYTIEMFGVDDLGGEQGPDVMGSLTISATVLFLPAVQR